MSNESSLRKQMDRGAKAKALLQNDLLVEAFNNIENILMQDWKLTSPDDKDRREDAWRSIRLLGLLKGELSRAVTDGEVSARKLLKIKNPNVLERMIK